MNKVEYKDLVEHFPLRGEYVFRAKLKQGKEVLWYDLDRFSPKIPTDDGAIFLKVKRITWETPIHRQTNGTAVGSGAQAARPDGGVKPNPPSGGQKKEHVPIDLDLGLLGNPQPASSSFRPQPNTNTPPLPTWPGGDLDLGGFGLSPSTTKPAQQPARDLFQDLL